VFSPTDTADSVNHGSELHVDDRAEIRALWTKFGLGASTPAAAYQTLMASAAGASAWGYSGAVQLAQIAPLGAVAAAMAFTAIPQTFRNLLLQVDARGDTAAANTGLNIRFAASGVSYDSGANYDFQTLYASGATPGAFEAFAQTSLAPISVPAASAAAGLSGGGCGIIENYAGTTFEKRTVVNMVRKQGTAAADLRVALQVGYWRNTSPIVAIQLFPTAGNFAVGSTATLYGLP
jgi:hypothetical protein